MIFFAGHGGSGGGSLIFMNNSGGYDWFYDYSTEFSSMSNTKVAVWAACYSGLDPDGPTGYRKSIAQKSIDQGAQSAIGWDQAIGNTAARKWTNKFFTELADSKTVSQAASAAGSVFLWPWDGSFSGWQVFGDGTTMVAYPAVNPKSGNSSSTQPEFLDASENDFAELINNYEYCAYELKDLGKRYYKTINGCLTNAFVDIYDDGTYKKSIEDITISEVANAETTGYTDNTYSPQRGISTNGVLFDRLVSSEEHIVYMKRDSRIDPIKLIYTEYASSDGITFQDVICVNLNTSELIDYDDICTIY